MTELQKPKKQAKRAPKPLRRASRPRRRRRGRSASLALEADALWSRLVRSRGSCEFCGSTNFLQAAHGFSRRYRATRWLPINGFCLCRACHVYYTHRSLEWTEILITNWGAAVYDELKALALKGEKPDLTVTVMTLETELQAK